LINFSIRQTDKLIRKGSGRSNILSTNFKLKSIFGNLMLEKEFSDPLEKKLQLASLIEKSELSIMEIFFYRYFD